MEEIVDIVEDDWSQHSQIDDHGLVGSTVLKDRVTELLDVRQAVMAADPSFFDEVATGPPAPTARAPTPPSPRPGGLT